MNINLAPFLIVWITLAVVVIALIVYHSLIARKEDEQVKFGLNMTDMAAIAPQQTALENKLHAVDKWGKILTAVAVAYGLALLALYLYQTWERMSRIGV
jgi:ABC-type lipoprotein release transport system permease subunit